MNEIIRTIRDLENRGIINTSGSYDLEMELKRDFLIMAKNIYGKFTEASVGYAIYSMGYNVEYYREQVGEYYIHIVEGVVVMITDLNVDDYDIQKLDELDYIVEQYS